MHVKTEGVQIPTNQSVLQLHEDVLCKHCHIKIHHHIMQQSLLEFK